MDMFPLCVVETIPFFKGEVYDVDYTHIIPLYMYMDWAEYFSVTRKYYFHELYSSVRCTPEHIGRNTPKYFFAHLNPPSCIVLCWTEYLLIILLVMLNHN